MVSWNEERNEKTGLLARGTAGRIEVARIYDMPWGNEGNVTLILDLPGTQRSKIYNSIQAAQNEGAARIAAWFRNAQAAG